MATIGDIATRLREQVLVDAATDYFSDTRIQDFVVEASREVAKAFGFPKRVEKRTTLAGADSIVLIETPRQVTSLIMDGLTIRRGPLEAVTFQQSRAGQRWPQVWFYDPSVGGPVLEFGPPVSQQVSSVVQYIGDPYENATPNSTTEVWNGLYADWHDLVLYRAAIKGMQQEMSVEKASYYTQQYSALMTEFAAFLGLPVPKEASS